MTRDELMDAAQELLVKGADVPTTAAQLSASHHIGVESALEIAETTAAHPITKILIRQNAR